MHITWFSRFEFYSCMLQLICLLCFVRFESTRLAKLEETRMADAARLAKLESDTRWRLQCVHAQLESVGLPADKALGMAVDSVQSQLETAGFSAEQASAMANCARQQLCKLKDAAPKLKDNATPALPADAPKLKDNAPSHVPALLADASNVEEAAKLDAERRANKQSDAADRAAARLLADQNAEATNARLVADAKKVLGADGATPLEIQSLRAQLKTALEHIVAAPSSASPSDLVPAPAPAPAPATHPPASAPPLAPASTTQELENKVQVRVRLTRNMRTYIHTHTHVCTHQFNTRANTCQAQWRTFTLSCTHTHAHTHTHANTHACMHVCTTTVACARMRAHMHTHTHNDDR
jgi:hypothetical protein